MRKWLFLCPVVVFLLAGCAAPAPAVPAPTPAVFVTPDASLAVPALGFATVKKQDNTTELVLGSRPEPGSPAAGRVAAGAAGKLLGLDQTGAWALVKFADVSGWAPVAALDLTLAQ